MLDRMVEHARREAPNECVGVLGARDGEAQLLVEAENARRSPLAYEIAPQELLRVHDRLDEDDLEVGAIYHSHTRTEPVPSQTDINLAFYPRRCTSSWAWRAGSPTCARSGSSTAR
jgi:proteasome lid subunit RPN8/RPN11